MDRNHYSSDTLRVYFVQKTVAPSEARRARRTVHQQRQHVSIP